MMKRFLLLLLCLMPVTYAAEDPVMVLDAEFWFMPRHGDVVAEHYGVRAAVKKLIADPDAYLALRYPDNETGELWGQELQAWLVSLGIVSDRIELQPGYDQVEGVALVVITANDEEQESISVIDAAADEVDEADAVVEVVVDETAVAVELAEEPESALPDGQVDGLAEEGSVQEDMLLDEQVELKQE